MLTIYKASAGSGKTFQLALHYLKMILGVKDMPDGRWKLNPRLLTDAPSQAHRHILAITFTNKATEEMRNRIVDSLNAVANADTETDHPYIGPLTRELGCSFDELRVAARHAMVSLLLDFTFFNVSTIDSFFQTIMRTFARELGIQGDYNIEIRSSDAIRSALNMLLDDLNALSAQKKDRKAERITRWLENRASEAKGKFNPFKRTSADFGKLVEDITKIYSEDFKPLQTELYAYLEKPDLLEAFRRQLKKITDSAVTVLQEIGNKAEGAVNMSGQQDFMAAGTKNLIRSLIDGTASFEKPSAMLRRMLNATRIIGKNEYGLLKKTEPNETYIAAIDTLSADLQEFYGRYSTARLLLSRVPHLEFIGLSLKYLEKLREESNMLILADTSSYISRIIGGSEIPFIYEHLGTHLYHFLIDEFQDTSRLQWKNIRPLVQNSHANGDDSLIIGDVKQAIYRFRNSDASILGHDLENRDFPDAYGRLVRGDNRSDNRNYRSAHGIVRFNNTLLPPFAAIALQSDSPSGYVGSQVRQLCSGRLASLPSSIALYPCNYKTREGEETVNYDINGDMLAQPPIPDEETRIRVLIRQIKRQARDEGYRWDKIAILFREKSGVKKVIPALLDEQIPVQSEESLFLKNSPSIKLLVSLMTMLVTAGMPESRMGRKEKDATAESASGEAAGDSSKRGIDHFLFEARYNFFRYKGFDGNAPLSDNEAVRRALDITADAPLDTLTDIATESVLPHSLEEAVDVILKRHPATLPAFIESILSMGLISESEMARDRDFIATFSDLAMQYSETVDNDLLGFLQWWDEHKDTLTVTPPPDSNAVRVLSIHKAKGLEFDHVHLVDFNWKLVDDRESTWLDLRPGEGAEKPAIDVGLGIPRDIFPPLICLDVTPSTMDYAKSPFKAFLTHFETLKRTDALNLAYVALTRAKKSLSVYFDYDPASDKTDTVGKVLVEALDGLVGKPLADDEKEDCLFLPEDAYNADTKAFFLEVKPSVQDSVSDHEEAGPDTAAEERRKQEQRLAEICGGRYTASFPAEMASLVSVDALDPDTGEDEWDDEEDGREEKENITARPADEAMEQAYSRRKRQKMEQTQRGLDLHEILSFIPYFTDEDDFEAVFGDAFDKASASQGFIAENRIEYKSAIERILSNSETKRWFSRDCHIETEVAFVRPAKENEIDPYSQGFVRRIDRLVEFPDDTVEIVDYKFTKGEDIRYEGQIREYIDAISAIFPHKKVRGYLWYVDMNDIKSFEK